MSGFLELALVILIAAVLGIIAKFLKQPIMLAYLAAGLLIAYFGFFNLSDKGTLSVFSDLGIMFLLFLVGLEINYTSLRLVGKASLILGLLQLVVTAVLGFWIAELLGFDNLNSLYISVALTFSSTAIVVKLLSDKRDMNSLYGKLTVGCLLVQDLVAVAILILLSGVDSGTGFQISAIIMPMLKGVVLLAAVYLLSRHFFPFVFDKFARSEELLFLFTLAWVFLLAAVMDKFGFSTEIAGFLAGVALANSGEHFEVASRIRPLRDFFILIFFVILGSSIVFSDLHGLIMPIIALSVFVLIGNPIIVLIIMGLMGYRRRTSFLAAVTTAQISEFSLILAAAGLKLDHIGDGTVSTITAVGIITIILSTYLIVYSNQLFKLLDKPLKIFERRKKITEDAFRPEVFDKPIVLFGCHRTGGSIAMSLPREKLLIVDFDPEVIKDLKRKDYDFIFGDITDPEVFEKSNCANATLVISTSPDLEDNLYLLNKMKRSGGKGKVILRAETAREAEILYGEKADYVLLPELTSGQYLGKTIAIDPEMKVLEALKAHDLSLIRELKSA
ncbi:MAG: cation:proton antiporter [Patescibacteria group bacterium]